MRSRGRHLLGIRHERLSRITAAVVLALSLLVASAPTTPAVATTCTGYCYALQWRNSGTNGVDGYISGSVISGGVPAGNHVADWVGPYYNPPGTGITWAQAGEYQGYLPNSNSPSTLSTYAEWNPCGHYGGGYGQIDRGAPPQTNYAFYVFWAGDSTTMRCQEDGYNQVTEYRFRIQQGNLNNPIVYGYFRSSWGYPEATLEDFTYGSLDNMGDTWFGTDDTHQPQAGHGLHLYARATNTWAIWTDTRTVYPTPSAGMFYQSLAANYAAHAY